MDTEDGDVFIKVCAVLPRRIGLIFEEPFIFRKDSRKGPGKCTPVATPKLPVGTWVRIERSTVSHHSISFCGSVVADGVTIPGMGKSKHQAGEAHFDSTPSILPVVSLPRAVSL
jgi:hypothetical protein